MWFFCLNFQWSEFQTHFIIEFLKNIFNNLLEKILFLDILIIKNLIWIYAKMPKIYYMIQELWLNICDKSWCNFQMSHACPYNLLIEIGFCLIYEFYQPLYLSSLSWHQNVVRIPIHFLIEPTYLCSQIPVSIGCCVQFRVLRRLLRRVLMSDNLATHSSLMMITWWWLMTRHWRCRP